MQRALYTILVRDRSAEKREMPSPVDWTMYPSYRWTASIISFNA